MKWPGCVRSVCYGEESRAVDTELVLCREHGVRGDEIVDGIALIPNYSTAEECLFYGSAVFLQSRYRAYEIAELDE